MTYHSEYGQDRWLEEHLFRGKRNGVFVEFGALDGLLHSNTLFFERERDWSGVLIEANPSMFVRLLQSDRRAAKVLGAVGGGWGIAEFTGVEDVPGWSGMDRHIHMRHWQRIAGHPVRRYCVATMPLEAILDWYELTAIDLLSVDVEGAEYDVLAALDFARIRPAVIAVENNYGEPAVEQLLTANGYRKTATLEIDDIYVAAT